MGGFSFVAIKRLVDNQDMLPATLPWQETASRRISSQIRSDRRANLSVGRDSVGRIAAQISRNNQGDFAFPSRS